MDQRRNRRPLLCDWELEWVTQMLECKPPRAKSRNLFLVSAYLCGESVADLSQRHDVSRQYIYSVIRANMKWLEAYSSQVRRGHGDHPSYSLPGALYPV